MARGVGVGTVMGATHFSSSALLSAINSEVTSNPTNVPMEPGVTPAPNASVIQPDQGWYEITTVSMHQLNFWMEFERLIFGHITPGRLYAVLLQPCTTAGHRITLGTSFNIDSNSSIEAIQAHFEPILVQMEDDYNEQFDLETRIKITDIGPSKSPAHPSPQFKSSATRGSSQTNSILTAMQAQTQALLEANKAQTNAFLESIKSLAPQPAPQALSTNWEPLITVGYYSC
jgi:hypothetical protein